MSWAISQPNITALLFLSVQCSDFRRQIKVNRELNINGNAAIGNA
jgi:hypothetical protein